MVVVKNDGFLVLLQYGQVAKTIMCLKWPKLVDKSRLLSMDRLSTLKCARSSQR